MTIGRNGTPNDHLVAPWTPASDHGDDPGADWPEGEAWGGEVVLLPEGQDASPHLDDERDDPPPRGEVVPLSPAPYAAGDHHEAARAAAAAMPAWWPDELLAEALEGDWQRANAADAFEEAVLSTPDQDESKPVSVKALRFPGRSADVALVLAGVHGSEPQGVTAARRLVDELKKAAAAGKKPKLTLIVIPELFDKGRRKSSRRRYVLAGSKEIEPNRNFPAPGESYDYARERGRRRADKAELLDCRGAPLDQSAVTPRMLAETRILVQLVEREKPVCAVSIHAHGVPGTRGDGPGIFVDPRGGFNEHTDVAFDARGQADDALTRALLDAALARLAPSLPLTTDDGKSAVSHPFHGNLADPSGSIPTAPTPTVHYTSTKHPCGASFGTWAPEPDKLGIRPGITTLTIELPRYGDAAKALDAVIDAHVGALVEKLVG